MSITEQDARDLTQVHWAHEAGPFQALGLSFGVRSSDPAIARYMEGVFEPLSSAGPAEHTYSIVDWNDGRDERYAVFFDDEELLATGVLRYPVSYALWHVNQEAVKRSDAMLFHASAAEHEGRALLFPAAMESGKTTLVAGLVRAGLRYLTDEAVALDPSTGIVVPYPRSLSVDEGSWEVLADLEPEVPEELQQFVGIQWQVPPTSIRPDAIAPACPPAFIISPRYDAEAETRLEPMSRAEALVALIENSFNFQDFGRDGLDALRSVVARCDCYRLTHSNLAEACSLIDELL